MRKRFRSNGLIPQRALILKAFGNDPRKIKGDQDPSAVSGPFQFASILTVFSEGTSSTFASKPRTYGFTKEYEDAKYIGIDFSSLKACSSDSIGRSADNPLPRLPTSPSGVPNCWVPGMVCLSC